MPVPTNTKVYCAVHDYAGKADLSRGCWNSERKLGVTTRFSEIIELKFGKKMRYTIVCFRAFSDYGCLIISDKIRGYPQFSFCFPITLAKICFSFIVINCAKIPLY